MNPTTTRKLLAAMLAALPMLTAACDRTEPSADSDHAAQPDEAGQMPTNRIAIPAGLREFQGITFVGVEARRIDQTLRAPGAFEYQPAARREYRTMLPGRVEILVDQFETVEAGDVLYRIDSPDWRQLQQDISEAYASVDRAQARLASFGPLRQAHRNHEMLLERTIEVRRERVRQLEAVSEAGGGRVGELSEARAEVTTAEAELAEVLEKEAELEADEAVTKSDLESARVRLDLLLDSAAAILSIPVETLTAAPGPQQDGRPLWRRIQVVEVAAQDSGVVESLGLTNGAWADQETPVVSIVQTDRLRFRAVALQSDLSRLSSGLPARIVPPTVTRQSHSIDLADTMTGTLQIGLAAQPDQRTIEVIVVPDALTSWARAGVSAHLEIITDTTTSPVLAVPLAAVQRDGLTPVLFRRDPDDPNSAIRIAADLGADDGRWVEVRSGLRLGDEVVLDGAFQLMLATAQSGTRQQGGHFHADGTFHAGEDH